MPQLRNDQLIDNLKPEFRSLYSPAHAFADAVAMLLAMPAVVGVWPGSVTDAAGQMIDISGNANHLTNNNSAAFNVGAEGLRSCVDYDGTNQYHSHADGAPFDIIGNEAYIGTPGLTIGGWFYFDDATIAAVEFLMGKGTTVAGASSYWLERDASEIVTFKVSDGASIDTVGSTVVNAVGWQYIVGKYTPSTQLDINVSDAEESNAVGITATLNNSTTIFTIGASGTPSLYLDGRAMLCFLCSSAVPDHYIQTLYDFTRPLFGL